jgi:hypothetical protein
VEAIQYAEAFFGRTIASPTFRRRTAILFLNHKAGTLFAALMYMNVRRSFAMHANLVVHAAIWRSRLSELVLPRPQKIPRLELVRWVPGHWNGMELGPRPIHPPSSSPGDLGSGHWEQQGSEWVWVAGHWAG